MEKPQPVPTAETRAFWEGCARQELLFQRCKACGTAQFYPRAHCAACQSFDLEWERSSGRGTIHTFTLVHRAPTAAFKSEVPYVLALVDIAEGFRMMVNIVGPARETAAIGLAVRIVFQETASGQWLPQAEIAG